MNVPQQCMTLCHCNHLHTRKFHASHKSISKTSEVQKLIRKPSASAVAKDKPTGTMTSIASNALPVSVNP